MEELSLRDQGSQLLKLHLVEDNSFSSPKPYSFRDFTLSPYFLMTLLAVCSCCCTFALPPAASGNGLLLWAGQTVQHSSHLAHLTVLIYFIKSTCWKVELWAPFLELDIQRTTVMMFSGAANPLPGHLQTCWVIQEALRE